MEPMKKKRNKTGLKGLKFADEATLTQHRGVRIKKPRKRQKRTTVRQKRLQPTMKAA